MKLGTDDRVMRGVADATKDRLSTPDPDCDVKAEALEQRKEQAQRGEITLLFEVEVDLNLLPGVMGCWTRRGQQRKARTPGPNVKRYGFGTVAREGRRAHPPGIPPALHASPRTLGAAYPWRRLTRAPRRGAQQAAQRAQQRRRQLDLGAGCRQGFRRRRGFSHRAATCSTARLTSCEAWSAL